MLLIKPMSLSQRGRNVITFNNGFGLGEVADFENKTSYQNLIRQFCMLALVAPFYH